GNTGVWNQIAVDEDLGLAYLPVETPSSDFYGGLRPGNNLFAESIVAIDYKTGVRKWHFQLVHHPIWNMDIAAAPILVDLTVGRHEVARRLVRSRDAPRVHPVVHVVSGPRAVAAADQRVLRSAVRLGQRVDRRALHFGAWRKRRRRCARAHWFGRPDGDDQRRCGERERHAAGAPAAQAALRP